MIILGGKYCTVSSEFIRRAEKRPVVPKLNGTHRLLFYADDVNILGDSTDTIKRNRK
jgi:hypothetical protein